MTFKEIRDKHKNVLRDAKPPTSGKEVIERRKFLKQQQKIETVAPPPTSEEKPEKALDFPEMFELNFPIEEPIETEEDKRINRLSKARSDLYTSDKKLPRSVEDLYEALMKTSLKDELVLPKEFLDSLAQKKKLREEYNELARDTESQK